MEESFRKQLKLEVSHIFDSGANEIRVCEMVERFAERYASACSAPSSIGEDEIEEAVMAAYPQQQYALPEEKARHKRVYFRKDIEWVISRLSERKIVLPELKPMPRLNDSEYTYRKAWNECLSEIKRLNPEQTKSTSIIFPSDEWIESYDGETCIGIQIAIEKIKKLNGI